MARILGMGNALVDIMTKMDSDDYLHRFGLPKGSMTLVSAETSSMVQEGTRHLEKTIRSGGSAANTIHGLANLGAETGFIGKIGQDELGKVFYDDLVTSGINPHLSASKTRTGHAVALMSPDAERTFATYLGAAVELQESDLSQELFSQYDIFHIEGYIVQNHSLLESALKLARKVGLKVSLDMASYNVVDQNRDFLEEMLKHYVDIVFANEDESRSLTGMEPEEALEKLSRMCEISVVKIGSKGSLIKSKNRTWKIGIIDLPCIDTTGAGDLYASGFLYGIEKGYPLDKCGNLGALLAGRVIAETGPKIPKERWKEIRRMI